ncbi:MAG: type II toxin-antitoxin system VapC family toxin [Pseudonocardia sp.]
MRILLDTNVVLWMALEPESMRSDVVDLVEADATTLLLSAVVQWEISIKWRTGRLPLPEHPREWIARLSREFGVETLPVVPAHALQVADLPDHHKDPFDRLLIAQAQVEGIPIVTGDGSFARYDVAVITAR